MAGFGDFGLDDEGTFVVEGEFFERLLGGLLSEEIPVGVTRGTGEFEVGAGQGGLTKAVVWGLTDAFFVKGEFLFELAGDVDALGWGEGVGVGCGGEEGFELVEAGGEDEEADAPEELSAAMVEMRVEG